MVFNVIAIIIFIEAINLTIAIISVNLKKVNNLD